MREAAPFALLACACSAAVVARPPAAPAPVTPAVESAAASSDAGATDSYDDLARLGSTIAPGMHEVARKPGVGGGEPVDLVRAETRDACVRAAFDADGPVVTKLVDENGQVLASLPVPSTHGVLAEQGPVCIRKGEVARGVAEGSSARVRWMAWASP